MNIFRQITIGLALVLSQGLTAQPSHWLAERAASSDLVVLAQLERVDYDYERDFPVGGEAWFRPLIRYKTSIEPRGLLIVQEQGMHANECYFDDPLPWDERPRYLLFLNHDPETDSVRGHPDGCAIEILVRSDNSYAARWPQPAFGNEDGRGDAVLAPLVQQMEFQGPRSRIDASDMLDHQRRARAEREFMRIEGTDLVPTRGIDLSELRRRMQPGLVDEEQSDTRDRLREMRDQMLEQAREGD
jgi:hypothetical protein